MCTVRNCVIEIDTYESSLSTQRHCSTHVCYDRSCPRSGTTTHTSGDENQIRSRNHLGKQTQKVRLKKTARDASLNQLAVCRYKGVGSRGLPQKNSTLYRKSKWPVVLRFNDSLACNDLETNMQTDGVDSLYHHRFPLIDDGSESVSCFPIQNDCLEFASKNA